MVDYPTGATPIDEDEKGLILGWKEKLDRSFYYEPSS